MQKNADVLLCREWFAILFFISKAKKCASPFFPSPFNYCIRESSGIMSHVAWNSLKNETQGRIVLLPNWC
jgi:hypothetical protein